MIITTRQECATYLQKNIKNSTLIEIAANEGDIKMFLKRDMTSNNIDDELKEQIKDKICLQAKGMYVPFFD